MIEMSLPNRPVGLAEFLDISIEALRKQMKRMGLIEGRFNRHAELPDKSVAAILEKYGKEVPPDTLSASIETDNDKSGQSDKSDRSQLPSGQPIQELKRTNYEDLVIGKTDIAIPIVEKRTTEPTEITDKNIKDTLLKLSDKATETDSTDLSCYNHHIMDVLLASIALVSMYVQMNHTAAVVGGAALQAWAYALSIQFTGLALTLYKGKLAYLRIFAFAEFAINLLHYRPWASCELIEGVSVCGGYEEWTRSILLSALIAFTIFSYVEIFAARRNDKMDKL